MKKWFRRALFLLLVLALMPLLLLGGLALSYYQVVRQQPGSLPVPFYAGVLGAEVNVFSGTGGYPWVCAHNSPAATMPFGMVRLGPDTASLFLNRPALNLSGYYYGDNKLLGFSHTRLVGAGVTEGGNFRVLPVRKAERTGGAKPVYARFNHTREAAFPGYYAVQLPSENILAELTATTHCGIHRYTFPEGEAPRLLFEVTSTLARGRCENALCRLVPERGEVEASVRYFGKFSARYGGLDLHCVLRFNRPFEQARLWRGEEMLVSETIVQGSETGACLEFAPGGPVELRLGLSAVSIEQARLNLDEEAGSHSFEVLCDRAKQAWEDRLACIRIQGGTEEERRIFYTALYRSFQMPTRFSEVNGVFRGFDKALHQVEESHHYYSDFSLWDSFRTVHPLYNLVARPEQRDMIRSLIEMAKAGESLPRWASGTGYAGSMFGTPADMMITEAWLKGIRDFDMDTAWFYMHRSATDGPPTDVRCDRRDGLQHYRQYGYCPDDLMEKSVSRTLEFSWADYSLSLLARALGKEEEARLFDRQARSYRQLWNPETRYFQPKDSQGQFTLPFKPDILSYVDVQEKYTRAYVEGSAAQWRWCLPFDGDELCRLFGGPEAFVQELESYMEGVQHRLGHWNPGPHYWHGNEPYFHAPYLFIHGGRADLARKWLRWIMAHKYADNFVGLEGNDDGGTLSAWYVLSALGLYPIAGTDRYWIGTPLFDRAELKLDDTTTLTILAENNSAENMQVKALYLNDEARDSNFIHHHEIAQGGTLRFVMSADAGK